MKTWDRFVLEQKVKNLNDYQKVIREQESFIFNSATLDNKLFSSIPYYEFDYDHEHDIFKYFQQLIGKDNLWDIVKVICNEDLDWTKWRNEKLTGIYYHKYTLKPEYVEGLNNFLEAKKQKYLTRITEINKEIKKENADRDKRKSMHSVVKTYRNIRPKGGENGQDGYLDVDVKNNITGDITRVVARNVFDFGYYSFPKRVEGTDKIFECENWHDEEKKACFWVDEFGEMETGIRM